MKKIVFAILLPLMVLFACSPIKPIPTPLPEIENPQPTLTPTAKPSAIPSPTVVPTKVIALIPTVESWEGVPVMPGATSGTIELGDYVYTVEATLEEITSYYEQALTDLGWQAREDKTKLAPGTAFTYYKEGTFVFFMIQTKDGEQMVFMHFVQE